MSHVPGGRRDFRFPWRSRRQIAKEVADEMSFHLEQRREELESEGLAAEAARLQAEREFGNVPSARRELERIDRGAEIRDRSFLWLEELRQDGRFAWRSLRRNPGFSTLAIVVLALGIGANTTIFSIVNALLLKPLVIERPEELRGIYAKSTTEADTFSTFSYPNYVDLRAATTTFADLAAFVPTVLGFTEDGTTRQSLSMVVTANYFEVFGVPLFSGRGFTAEEERPSSNIPVAVLSHQFWERSHRRHDVGDTVLVNGRTVSIVGISAPGFTGTTALLAPDFWLPTGMYGSTVNDFSGSAEIDLGDRRQDELMVVGRLATPAGDERADAELAALGARLAADHPDAFRDFTVTSARLSRVAVSSRPTSDGIVSGMSAALMGMAALVLLIACLNLANMLLARGAARRSEIAIRQSLGGSRARILRQLLTEGMSLSLVGGAIGLAMALGAGRLLMASIAPILPFGELNLDLSPDPRVLSATLGFAMLGTLFFALGPALRLVRIDHLEDLKVARGEAAAASSTPIRPRNALVMAQIALSLGLLTTAGLFIRAAWRAADADPGFDLSHGIVARVDGTYAGYDPAQVRNATEELVARLRSLPGVESVALASNVPFSSISETAGVFLQPTPDPDAPKVSAEHIIAGRDYFRSLGLELLRGRDFSQTEETTDLGQQVAIVGAGLASTLWPDEEPLGQTVWIEDEADPDLRRALSVIGIAPPIRQSLLSERSHLYQPFGQSFRPGMNLHIRVAAPLGPGEAASRLVEGIGAEIREVDARLPVLSLKRLSSIRDDNVELWMLRTVAKLFLLFGLVALFLASVGVYAVKAYGVARRTREFGIRMALGAEPGDVLRMVLREGMWVTLGGVAIGMLVAVGLGRGLDSMLFEVSSTDPVSFLVAPAVLLGAALLAAIVPARRATRVAPTAALRCD